MKEETENRRRCYKCLLREMDEEAYMKQLHRYIELLDRDVKTAEEIYKGRLSLCKQCDYLEAGTCQACGCYVELRAAVKKSHCPYKKGADNFCWFLWIDKEKAYAFLMRMPLSILF